MKLLIDVLFDDWGMREKKRYEKSLFYIISNVQEWYFSLAWHPSAQHLYQTERSRLLEFYYTSCYLLLFYLSLLLFIREANVRNTNQFQCYLNVLRSFLLVSLPHLHIVLTNFFAVLLLLLILLLRTHFSTQLVLSHRIRFPFNRNRFVINSVLTIDVRVCVCTHLFHKT